MRTNDQSKNKRRNNQIQGCPLLGKNMTLTKGILSIKRESKNNMMGVVSILEWNHNEINQNHHDNKGEALYELIETITCSSP
jgi:hypothetical protein